MSFSFEPLESGVSVFVFKGAEAPGHVLDSGLVAGTFAISPKMIVSRMQDHVVETSDGDLHMLINLGLGGGLVLFTSTDNGASWHQNMTFNASGFASTADIRIASDEDEAIMVYTTRNGAIAYAKLDYDTVQDVWTVAYTTTVVDDVMSPNAAHPTITLAASGRLWIAYSEETDDGVVLSVAWSDNAGRDWTETVVTTLDAEAGSARILATEDGVGLIYATAETVTWATYSIGEGVWNFTEIDRDGAIGRYASHFSTAQDGDTLYIVMVGTNQELSFMVYDGVSDSWTRPADIPGVPHGVTTAQISVETDGGLYVTYDDPHTDTLIVMESLDGGQSWSDFAELATPDWIATGPVRMEAPEHFDDELIVFQQVRFPGNDQLSFLWSWTLDTTDGSSSVSASFEAPDWLV
ncbi:hypothetical protein SAMN05421853_102425 [Roseivivax halotolerans]|uniref:BNR repeat-like domain-containing protein n=1 Tax=Roseivivax halotolerans TaxID=93684 RepID=A0A1I5WLJ6_9RHOB|nr:sialidase family protein [Roseivivax halotolerans]SFQ20540.1 hypothetical protein SAMN05421853_102425 [Roseivivax halotolerans]